MKTNLLFSLLLLGGFAFAQRTADFEEFNLEAGEFLNNAPDDIFNSGNISLFNDYNEAGDFWQGWAISADTDTETPGFMNQYSSASGSGYDGSSTYALTYAFFPQNIDLTGDAVGAPLEGMYVNNGTFAYLNMLNGGAPGKRFGGETGDDPDFFLLTLKGELNGEVTADSIDFYLADYRFENNSEDYIVTEWTYIDLTSLGNVDRVIVSLSSSDNGEFGMNTPAYVFVDNIRSTDMPLSVREEQLDWNVQVYPNPAFETLRIEWPSVAPGQANIYTIYGQLVKSVQLNFGANAVDVSKLPAGQYVLRFANEEGWNAQSFSKF